MKKIVAVFWLFLAAAPVSARADAFAELKSDRLTVQVDARENANLIYQLDCLADATRCTRDVYLTLWQTQLGFDQEDQRQIDAWGRLRNEMQRRESAQEPQVVEKSSLPLALPGRDAPWDKTRAAGFVAKNDGELKRSWAALMPADDLSRALSIVARFRPRFHGWWMQNEPTATGFAPALEDAMHRARAFELLSAAAQFYEAELGDGRVYVHLFIQPKLKTTHTSGERIGAHLVIEIVPGENPDERVDVIVHELAHHVFGQMPAQRLAAFMERMIAAGPGGVPAWNLFNEVQATVIGNILAAHNVLSAERFQKEIDRPQSFYGDEAIDLGARAALPVLEKALGGGAMAPAFAGDYLAAMQRGLGAKLETAPLYLRTMALNLDTEDSDHRTVLRKAVRSSSMWTVDPLGDPGFASKLEKYPALSAAVIARSDRLNKLDGVERLLGVSPAELTGALGSSSGIVFVARRSPQAYSFVVVARDVAQFDGLIAAIPQCVMKPGVCRRFD